MNKLLIILIIIFSSVYSFAQNTSPNPTSKYAPKIVSKNMDWYKITFDVELDENDTLNPELINLIDFNLIENLRQENEDVETEIEINGEEIEIILYSYQKCAQNKNTNSHNTNESNH